MVAALAAQLKAPPMRLEFSPAIDSVSMRPWDGFFWWVEFTGAPPRTVVLPSQWPPGQGVRALSVEAKRNATNGLVVEPLDIKLYPAKVAYSTAPESRTTHRSQSYRINLTYLAYVY